MSPRSTASPTGIFTSTGGRYEGSTLESIDPGGRQWRELGPERAIGCIVYPATEIEAPGVIRHVYGDRFPIGEPSGEISPDVKRLSDLFVAAGMQAPILDRIRDEIWLKLWGNVCLNPISALTHATLDVICSDPTTRALSKSIMLETQAIAETFGVKFSVDVERRIEGARKVGAHKTSMLQDLERGRPMEIDPLVSVVQEMGRQHRFRRPPSMPCWRWWRSAPRRGTIPRKAHPGDCPPCGNKNRRFCMRAWRA